MDCTEVKELLSTFYDGELLSDKRTAVAEHLKGCHDCARELESFRSLSTLAEGLTHPAPAPQLWHQIEKQLDAKQGAKSHRPAFLDWLGRTNASVLRCGLAAATAILIAVGWFAYSTWFEPHGDHQFTAVFGQYLEEFRIDPYAAQKILLAQYQGQAVDPRQAVQAVGYRPAVADGIPDGYSIESTYVMKMPCCTCVQCLCKRSDGTTIAIFEHDDEEMRQWFGDRPEVSAICNGAPCSVVELHDRLAASWKRGKRHITVIGARDTAEIGELVAWFDDRKRVSEQ